MTDYAILRFAKLKTWGQIGASLSHNYRTRDTPNADANLSHLNEHSHETTQEVKNALAARIPEKRRSDAVLCLEHLITASPSWSGWGTEKETEFFKDSIKWLEDRYGKENVIATSIHRDETTPHLVAYVVPLDESTGRLNAKKWTAGNIALSKMQTSFAKSVEHLGLKRGIEGSKAEHQGIKEYYAKVNEALKEPDIDFSKLPEPTIKDRMNPRKYAEQAIEGILLDYEKSKLLANEAKKDKREIKALREIVEKAEPYLSAIQYLPDNLKHELNVIIKKESDRLHQEYERQQQQEVEQYETLKNTYYKFESYVNECIAEKTNTDKDIEQRDIKTKRWLDKKHLTHEEVREDRMKIGGGVYEVPSYYITEYEVEKSYESSYKKYKQKVAEKAEAENIAFVVSTLKEKTTEQNVLKDLNDYENYVQPVIVEFQLETKKEEQRRILEQQQAQRRYAQQLENERIQREALENYQAQKKLESERLKAIQRAEPKEINKSKSQDNRLSLD